MENHHAINGNINYKWQCSIAMLKYLGFTIHDFTIQAYNLVEPPPAARKSVSLCHSGEHRSTMSSFSESLGQ